MTDGEPPYRDGEELGDLPTVSDASEGEASELVVECSNSDCNRETRLPMSVVTGRSVDSSAWAIKFVAIDDDLVVDEVHCPLHRLDEEITDLAERQRRFAKKMGEALEQTRKLVDG